MAPRSLDVIVFPFDLFGNAGCAAGAELLADAIEEMCEDTDREPRPTRSHSFHERVEFQIHTFDDPASIQTWRETGAAAIRQALARKGFTLWLGGNHLSILPVYEALKADDLIVQFDAHLDLFQLHDTTESLSHGNFLLHAKSRPRIVNVGHRDLITLPQDMRAVYDEAIPSTNDSAAVIPVLKRHAKSAPRIWIDIDADVFDPSTCPAVHQRVPFGPMPLTVLSWIESIWSDKVVGCSISEFDPGRDVQETSLNLLGWLVEWLMLKVCESPRRSATARRGRRR